MAHYQRTGMTRSLVAALAALGIALAGCGTDSAGTAGGEAQQSPGRVQDLQRFSEAFTSGRERDVIVYNSVESLLQDSSVVVDGTFVELAEGRTISEEVGERTFVDHYVVVKIQVDSVLTGALTPAEGEFVYMEVPLPPESSVDALKAVFPTGKRIVVVLAEWDPVQPEGIKQTNAEDGRPAGTRLTSPLPQGLFMEDADGAFAAPLASDSTDAIEPQSLDEAAELFAAVG